MHATVFGRLLLHMDDGGARKFDHKNGNETDTLHVVYELGRCYESSTWRSFLFSREVLS